MGAMNARASDRPRGYLNLHTGGGNESLFAYAKTGRIRVRIKDKAAQKTEAIRGA